MTGRKFVRVLIVVFVIALVAYLVTTPRGGELALTGITDANSVIVSPQISGRLIKLLVDEGSDVKKGELIAELDPAELQASLAAAKANVATLESSVQEAQHTFAYTDQQSGASIQQAHDTIAATNAQLQQARAELLRNQQDLARIQKLFEKHEIATQDRDHAEAAVSMSQANVQALESSVRAQTAALAQAQASVKQVDARKSAVSSAMAQLEQARAKEAEVSTQLGYTEIRAPIDGIVSVRPARQGEVLQPGAPIVVIVDIDHLWVRADVEETYIDSIAFGQKLNVRFPSGDEVQGTVFYKGVEGDFATQRDVSRMKRDIKTFAIKVAVPNPGRRLFTGMTATVLLPQPKQKPGWRGRF